MANSNKSWNQGVKDANAGKGMAKSYGKPDAVVKPYVGGYLTTKKNNGK
jgi:hypothetical protein